MQQTFKKQDGYLLIVASILIVITGFIVLVIGTMSAQTARSSLDTLYSNQALYLAESGLEHATSLILSFNSPCASLSVNNTLGAGSYSVTATGPFYVSSPTTLNGALDSSTITIPVFSTANYQSSGRIMIDQEVMSYLSKDATHFNNVVRGLDDTEVTNHNSGAPIGQFQCNLTSQGGVPSLTTPSQTGNAFGKRTLTETIQLVEAWSVGYPTGGNIGFIRWNNPTASEWQNYSPTISSNGNTLRLRGLYMNSYVDGWAVGGPVSGAGSSLLYHWNGSSWTAASTAGIPNTVLYNGVYCYLYTNCIAVGSNSGSGRPTIIIWNGTNWSNPSSFSGSVSNDNLFSISCNSINCWAVGDHNAVGVFYSSPDGQSWTGTNVSGTLSSFPYKGLFCNSPTDCWAVGSNNVFARLNGANWTNYTAAALPSSSAYYGIWCNNSNDCWTAGDAGAIGHWNGTTWTKYASPTSNNLRYVACNDTNYCYIAGVNTAGNSGFLFWNGKSWTQMPLANSVPNVEFDGMSVTGPIYRTQSAWAESYS